MGRLLSTKLKVIHCKNDNLSAARTELTQQSSEEKRKSERIYVAELMTDEEQAVTQNQATNGKMNEGYEVAIVTQKKPDVY